MSPQLARHSLLPWEAAGGPRPWGASGRPDHRLWSCLSTADTALPAPGAKAPHGRAREGEMSTGDGHNLPPPPATAGHRISRQAPGHSKGKRGRPGPRPHSLQSSSSLWSAQSAQPSQRSSFPMQRPVLHMNLPGHAAGGAHA